MLTRENVKMYVYYTFFFFFFFNQINFKILIKIFYNLTFIYFFLQKFDFWKFLRQLLNDSTSYRSIAIKVKLK